MIATSRHVRGETFEDTFPGNRVVFDSLAGFLREEKCIAFVGPLASTDALAGPDELVGRLADYAVERGRAHADEAVRWKSSGLPASRFDVIRRRLGEAAFGAFLKETFGPRRDTSGRLFGAAHAALLRAGFQGYVATSADPALEFARAEIRPSCRSTGTPTWQDKDEMHRWRTREVLQDECPMLWLRGYWQRPASLVLDGVDDGGFTADLYRETFGELWQKNRLVFVGFSVTDRQFSEMVAEMARAASRGTPRHIAVLGWEMASSGAPPNEEDVNGLRGYLASHFGLQAILIPLRREDPTALEAILASLTYASSAPALHDRWIHAPTNDASFTGREEEIARLDRWVRDGSVRTVAITGPAGTGKTALAGHWLRRTRGWRTRPFAGLFGWSFSQDADSGRFLDAFLEWARTTLHAPEQESIVRRVNAAAEILRRYPIVLVLDGFDALQERAEDAKPGVLLDGNARELLLGLCHGEHESLAVLTSRAPIADLERFLGTTFHDLDLRGLRHDAGALLLQTLQGRGNPAADRHVSEQLDGHPFALRLFAELYPPSAGKSGWMSFENACRARDGPPSTAEARLGVLLQAFGERLTVAQRRLLEAVSLFDGPVADDDLLRLARGLHGDSTPALTDDSDLTSELAALLARGVLDREPAGDGPGSSCQGLLRAHFRSAVTHGAERARAVAALLLGANPPPRVQTVRDLERVTVAIELLLQAGDFQVANEVYASRLASGAVFRSMLGPAHGLACTLGFVRDERRRQGCESALGKGVVRSFLAAAASFARMSGDAESALRLTERADVIARETKDEKALSNGLQGEADLLVELGLIERAARAADEALSLALETREEPAVRSRLGARARILALSGELLRAARDFSRANELERKNDPEGDELYSTRGVDWAELLLRSGHVETAQRRTAANLRICECFGWIEPVARCRWLLARCALAEGRHSDAEVELRQAESALLRGHALADMARVQLVAGAIALARGDADRALRRGEEALSIALPRNLQLIRADALLLQARARLAQHDAARASSLADEAVSVARGAYAWTERDALRVLADAATLVADACDRGADKPGGDRYRHAARSASEMADQLSARLVLTEDDLAEADAEAKAWLAEWEKPRAAA